MKPNWLEWVSKFEDAQANHDLTACAIGYKQELKWAEARDLKDPLTKFLSRRDLGLLQVSYLSVLRWPLSLSRTTELWSFLLHHQRYHRNAQPLPLRACEYKRNLQSTTLQYHYRQQGDLRLWFGDGLLVSQSFGYGRAVTEKKPPCQFVCIKLPNEFF